MDDTPATRFAAEADPAQAALRVGADLAGLDADGLWIAQIALGCDLTRDQVHAALTTPRCEHPHRHDALADVVNDQLIGTDVTYRVPHLDGTDPTS